MATEFRLPELGENIASGDVLKVLVSPGESVTVGQPILLFEAMKMQNELRSPEDGVVAEIAVEAGQAVESRERLYVLLPAVY